MSLPFYTQLLKSLIPWLSSAFNNYLQRVVVFNGVKMTGLGCFLVKCWKTQALLCIWTQRSPICLWTELALLSAANL